MAIDKTNRVVEIDLSTNQFYLHSTTCHDLMCLYDGKDGFWMLPYHGNTIYQWNSETNEKEAFVCQGCEITKRYIGAVIEVNDEIYALPAYSDNILKLDRSQRKFNKWLDYPKELRWRDERAPKFFRHIIKDGKVYLLPFNANGILTIGDGMGFVLMKSIGESYDVEPLQQYAEELRKDVIKEDISFTIEDCLKLAFLKKREEGVKNVGAAIWEHVNE